MPQLEVNTNQKNTHWTWAERTYGRQQQIIWAVFFQTNYIAQTLVTETRNNIADFIIWTTSSQSFGVVSTLSFNLFFLTIFCQFCQVVKLRNYEKPTKLKKISLLFWQSSFFYLVASKEVGDFFKFLWPFRKAELYISTYLLSDFMIGL